MPKRAKKPRPEPELPDEAERTDVFIVRELVLVDGGSPFQKWYAGLRDRRARLTIANRLERIRAGNLGDFQSVGEGVFELRIFYGPGYRLYFARVGETIIVLIGGGDKSTQEKDIAAAQKIWKENKEEFDAVA